MWKTWCQVYGVRTHAHSNLLFFFFFKYFLKYILNNFNLKLILASTPTFGGSSCLLNGFVPRAVIPPPPRITLHHANPLRTFFPASGHYIHPISSSPEANRLLCIQNLVELVQRSRIFIFSPSCVGMTT